MQKNSKILIIVFSLILIITTVGAFFMVGDNQDIRPKSDEVPFKPLDTSSQAIVAEYDNNKKITEGQLNTYININAFNNPQVSMLLSDTASEKVVSVLKNGMAKQLAVELFMAERSKSHDEAVKSVDSTIEEFEKALKEGKGKGKVKAKNLEEYIKDKGFTVDNLKEALVRSEKARNYLDSQFGDDTYSCVKVRHILIGVNDETDSNPGLPKRSYEEAKKIAEDVRQQLLDGADFVELAKKYSDDPGSKENGGLYDDPTEGYFKEFKEACETLPLGKISGLVKTKGGYHIMKVLDRYEKPFKDAPQDVRVRKEKEIHDRIVQKQLKFKSLMPEPKEEENKEPAAAE